MRAPSAEARGEIMAGPEREALWSDSGYFFSLCDHMVDDVTQQPDSADKAGLLDCLETIKKEAGTYVIQAGKADAALGKEPIDGKPTEASSGG